MATKTKKTKATKKATGKTAAFKSESIVPKRRCGKKVSDSEKLLVFSYAMNTLNAVLVATYEHTRLRKRKFDVFTKIYDPENCVWFVDEVFRKLKWMDRDDLDFLETNAGDYVEEADVYKPSCADVCDIAIYIERIAYMMREKCHVWDHQSPK